jgi:hypothetical protein
LKFFTRNWYESSQNVIASKKYAQHLNTIRAQLPPDLVQLSERLPLHDGLFCKALWNPVESMLSLQLRCGDQQVGYFDVTLMYSGRVRIVPSTE